MENSSMPLDVNQIWMEVYLRLRGFIASRVPQDAEVEDILQEVFLRMHRNLKNLKDPGRVISWIFQITRHAISDYYRSPNRRREIPAGSATDIEATFSIPTPPLTLDTYGSEGIRKELAACLLPMIRQLPDLYREALTLVELEGLTQRAAASQLGLSLSGVKSRVQRGRRALKRMLEECCALQLDRRRSITGYSVRNSDCQPCGRSPT